MIENFLKKFNQTLHYIAKKSFVTKLAALFLFFCLSSCSDQGCIEADDFGEYEYQVLKVKANGQDAACAFNYNLDIDSAEQPNGLINGLTTGSTTIMGNDGTVYTNTNELGALGCSGFYDFNIQMSCVDLVVSACQTLNAANSDKADAGWLSTDNRNQSQNYGVTIYPNSEVIIHATGSISLGDHVEYPSHYIIPTQKMPHSRDKEWDNIFFDVTAGQTFNIYFSGQWDDRDDDGSGSDLDKLVGGGPNPLAGGDSTADTKVYNGARRTVMYLEPAPDGYSFDSSKSTEEEGTLGVPLLPDPDFWECSYSSGVADCKNGDYTSYDNSSNTKIDNAKIDEVFSITSLSNLGRYGGMVRTDPADGFNDDPFASGTPSSISAGGFALENSTSDIVIPNSTDNAYRVYFKSDDASCNQTSATSPLLVSIQDDAGTPLESYVSRGSTVNAIDVTDTAWTSHIIDLEPRQQLNISAISGQDLLDNECSTHILVKFLPHKDITITKSGLVRFSMLNAAALTNQCTIQGSIINPANSSHVNFTSGSVLYEADFYEYDPLDTINPLKDLAVTHADPLNPPSWTQGVFVRKGQILRLAPETWNGTWTEESGETIHCGVGLAMHIQPRPALLCRGTANTLVDNPLCTPEYDSEGVIGCQPINSQCEQDLTDSFYCPDSCQEKHVCTPGDASNNYTKDCGTNPGSNIPGDGGRTSAESATCTYDLSEGQDAATFDEQCRQCAIKTHASETTSAKVTQDLDKCYDLENYSGKVSNIDPVTGFASDAEAALTKGAVELRSFNGNYGNLSSFTDTGKEDNDHKDNIIYQANNPATFATSGRLQFFFLDGNDFLNLGDVSSSYNNNTLQGSSYSGVNGFEIRLSGMLEYNNGQMLSVKLCDTKNDDTGVCAGSGTPVALEPKIVEFPETEPYGDTPLGTSKYKFLASGTLVRNAAVDKQNTDECTTDVVSSSSSSFYCHTKTTSTSDKYRLSFKIIDPEEGTCEIANPSNPANDTKSNFDGVKLKNPYFTTAKEVDVEEVDINAEDFEYNAEDYVYNEDDHVDKTRIGAICDTDGSGNIEKPLSPPPAATDSETYVTCKKEFYCGDKYANNSGSYTVTVKSTKPGNGNISNIIGSVVEPVIEVMDGSKDGTTVGQAERMYTLLVNDPKYQTILSICLVVMIAFYGMGTLMGVNEITHSELVNRVVKISLIYLFASPNGWYWFNEIVVQFFKDGTDYLAFMMATSFDNSESISNAIAAGDYYDKSILFGSVDKVFGMFFSDAVQKKVSALLFASIFGFVYLWIIYLSFMLYVYAVCNAVLLYLTAQIFISLLFILGPLFFIFTLFGQTKEMFDNWLKQLISFSLQQIFLLTTLAFFNMMMYEVIKMSLGYRICWDVVWSIKIFGTIIDLLSFWTIPSVSSGANTQAGSISGQDGIPSLFTILFIWVIASLMHKFISFMTDVASSISGGLKASSLGAGIKQAAAGVQNYASQRASNVYKGTIGAKMERLDQKLFDSGKLASKARRDRKAQNSKDAQNKGALRSAGNKAVEDYEKNNALKLAKMGPEEAAKAKQDVKNNAMLAKGKQLGLSEKDVERLKNSKGSTYEGSNVFGLALHSARQAASSGGTLTSSINDEGVSAKMSNSTFKKAMKSKRTTKEERAELMNAAESGALKVERSTTGKMKGALGSVKRGLANPVSTIKQAPKALGAAMNSETMRKLVNATGEGDYKAAELELEKEGKIDTMSAGTRFTRKADQKQKIEQRVTEQRNKRKLDKETASMNNPNMLAGLKHDAQEMDKREDKKTERQEASNTRSEEAQEAATARKEARSAQKEADHKKIGNGFGSSVRKGFSKVKRNIGRAGAGAAAATGNAAVSAGHSVRNTAKDTVRAVNPRKALREWDKENLQASKNQQHNVEQKLEKLSTKRNELASEVTQPGADLSTAEGVGEAIKNNDKALENENKTLKKLKKSNAPKSIITAQKNKIKGLEKNAKTLSKMEKIDDIQGVKQAMEDAQTNYEADKSGESDLSGVAAHTRATRSFENIASKGGSLKQIKARYDKHNKKRESFVKPSKSSVPPTKPPKPRKSPVPPAEPSTPPTSTGNENQDTAPRVDPVQTSSTTPEEEPKTETTPANPAPSGNENQENAPTQTPVQTPSATQEKGSKQETQAPAPSAPAAQQNPAPQEKPSDDADTKKNESKTNLTPPPPPPPLPPENNQTKGEEKVDDKKDEK